MNKSNYSFPWPQRFFILDITRGLAAIAVVLWHWQHFAYTENGLASGFDRTAQPMYAAFKIFYEEGAMRVEYFFLISGYIFFWRYGKSIPDKKITFLEFWIQRISRLYPLHLLTLLLVAFLQSIYAARQGNFFVYQYNDLYHFFLNLFLASKWGFEQGWSFNAPIWSVSIEILLYVTFFWLAYYSCKWQILVCLGISVAAFILAPILNHSIFQGLAGFYLGGFVYHATFLISTRFEKLKIAIHIVALTVWILIFINFYVCHLNDLIVSFGAISKTVKRCFPLYIVFPFTVCSLSLFEISLHQLNWWQSLKTISWIGDITYAIFLLHFPLQLVFSLAVNYGLLNSGFYLQESYFLAYFAILIPLSYFTYVFFEYPVQKALRRKFRYSRELSQQKQA